MRDGTAWLAETCTSDDREGIAALVLAGWVDVTRGGEWSRLSEVDRVDHIPRLLRVLLDHALGLAEDPEASARELVQVAAAHGQHRRTHGFDEEHALRELHVLRALISVELQRRFGAVSALSMIARADIALSLVTVATLRGFHSQLLKAQGRWPDVLEDLVRAKSP